MIYFSDAAAQYWTKHGPSWSAAPAGVCQCEVWGVPRLRTNFQLSKTAQPLSSVWSWQWGASSWVSGNWKYHFIRTNYYIILTVVYLPFHFEECFEESVKRILLHKLGSQLIC